MRFATQSLPRIAIGFVIWVVASILMSIHYQGVKAFLVRQVPSGSKDCCGMSRSCAVAPAANCCGHTACSCS